MTTLVANAWNVANECRHCCVKMSSLFCQNAVSGSSNTTCFCRCFYHCFSAARRQKMLVWSKTQRTFHMHWVWAMQTHRLLRKICELDSFWRVTTRSLFRDCQLMEHFRPLCDKNQPKNVKCAAWWSQLAIKICSLGRYAANLPNPLQLPSGFPQSSARR